MKRVLRFSLFALVVALVAASVFSLEVSSASAWSAGDPVTTSISFEGENKDWTFEEVAQSYFWLDPPQSMGGRTCTNRGMTFRLIQALAERQCPDGTFRTYDLDFKTGWAFGCAARIFGEYKIPAQGVSGDYEIVPGIFHGYDYSLGASPLSGDRTPSSFYSVRAASRSTGKVWEVSLAESAVSQDYFQVYEDWYERVYPKLVSGDVLTDEENSLNDLMNLYAANMQNAVLSGNEEDFSSKSISDGCGLSCYLKDGSLSYKDKDGTVKTLSMAESCMEGEGDSRHACLCMAMAYRVGQIVSEAWSDGIFHPEDVTVATGWNSDGAEEFFCDLLGVDSVTYGVDGSVTKPGDMTLFDCWYRISIKSLGKTFIFRGTENILTEDFLTLRRKVKGGDGSAEDKKALAARKMELWNAIQANPFYGGFEVRVADTTRCLCDVVPTSTLYYVLSDNVVRSMDLPDAAKEDNGSGGTKICLCQAVAFRVSQMISSRWADGVFRPEDISVETGWNSDGPIEFWVDQMGMSADDIVISGSATSGDRLSLSDCWYKVTIKSTGETYLFRGTSDLYVSDFLDLRALFKQKKATAAQTKRMKELRAKTVNNVCSSPFVGRISVEEPESAEADSLPTLQVGDKRITPKKTSEEELEKISSLKGVGKCRRGLLYEPSTSGTVLKGMVSVKPSGTLDTFFVAEKSDGELDMLSTTEVAGVSSGRSKEADGFSFKINNGDDFDLDSGDGVKAKVYVIQSVKDSGESDSDQNGDGSSGGCSVSSFSLASLFLLAPLMVLRR